MPSFATAAKTALFTLAAGLATTTALHAGILIKDPYALVSTKMAKSGAAFMEIVNTGDQDDRLVGADTDIARKAQLHTHKIDANGVARMVHVSEGFPIPAGGSHALKRGGDHVMLMGLKKSLSDGDVVHLILHFEKAGDIPVDVPVDLSRKGGMKMKMDSDG